LENTHERVKRFMRNRPFRTRAGHHRSRVTSSCELSIVSARANDGLTGFGRHQMLWCLCYLCASVPVVRSPCIPRCWPAL